MDEYRKTFNVFEQIKSVKRILAAVVPDGDSFRLRGLLQRCVRYKLGVDRDLRNEERQVFDLLLKHKLKPKTVYEWLLLEDVPEHIREKMIQRKINVRDARAQYVQWKHMCTTRAGKELMEEIKNVIGRLRWKSQEESLKLY